MSQNDKVNQEDTFQNVEHALTKTEQFVENNQKLILMAVVALIVLIGGYWGLKKFYFQGKDAEAQERIVYAIQYFEKDSFQVALDGDINSSGFLDIIDDYGSTESGNLSNYYAGLCYLHMGKFQEAIDYLKDFSSDDELLQYVALGAIGDAYLELGNKEKALNYYEDAIEGDNEFTAPIYLMKLGLLLEEKGQYKKAIEAFSRIKNEYMASNEARQVDKYITRVELLMKK